MWKVWDEKRDARAICRGRTGSWPILHANAGEGIGMVAPLPRVRRVKGDDGGCFEAALKAVRTYGGVLEHPAASAAWDAFGLMKPPRCGGWIAADWFGGFTCCVDQGYYGHRAQKATWLYACMVELPILQWGKSSGGDPARGWLSLCRRAPTKGKNGDLPKTIEAPTQRDAD